jgi:putative endonuclease
VSSVEVVGVRAKDAVGRYGEDVAARHLLDAGMAVLERNWRCEHGEIDIVARDGDVLVVCEVKTRSGTAFGTPAESVTRAKVARLRRLTAAWLAAHDVHPASVRIDVIAVLRSARGAAQVEHLQGVA